jgi:hypothetical protein
VNNENPRIVLHFNSPIKNLFSLKCSFNTTKCLYFQKIALLINDYIFLTKYDLVAIAKYGTDLSHLDDEKPKKSPLDKGLFSKH